MVVHGYWWPWWNSRQENSENKSLVRWNQSPTVRVREIYIYHWWLLNNPWSSCLEGCNVQYNTCYCWLMNPSVILYESYHLIFSVMVLQSDEWILLMLCDRCSVFCQYSTVFCRYVLTGTKKTRPSSAPVSRSNKPQDVWDKVRLRYL